MHRQPENIDRKHVRISQRPLSSPNAELHPHLLESSCRTFEKVARPTATASTPTQPRPKLFPHPLTLEGLGYGSPHSGWYDADPQAPATAIRRIPTSSHPPAQRSSL